MSNTRADIFTNLATRLAKITAANGYQTDVKKVYFDKIPMGMELNSYECPAIFFLDREDPLTTQFPTVVGKWEFDLQLWHNEVSDTDMMKFVGDIFRCIYADSPVAQVNGSFRSIHPNIVEIIPLSIASDLHMIEANRVSVVRLQVHYRTKLFDL